MPELPEVETIVRGLRPALIGRRIRSVRILEPKIFRTPAQTAIESLSGAVIKDISRKGKLILFTLRPEMTLMLHLKMTGQPLLIPAPTPIDRHTHAVFEFSGIKLQLRYRDVRKFGFFSLTAGSAEPGMTLLSNIGPDPFEITAGRFVKMVQKKDSTIKALLLDQSLISGLGNIYVDESLFRAGIHPQTRTSHLSEPELKKLFKSVRTILLQAIKWQGSTLKDYRQPDGLSGGFQNRHQVYGRQGEPCPSCQSLIQKIRVAGRGTHFCNVCQRIKAPFSQ
jgi:formamidopyrimidine-DNA glycosylase